MDFTSFLYFVLAICWHPSSVLFQRYFTMNQSQKMDNAMFFVILGIYAEDKFVFRWAFYLPTQIIHLSWLVWTFFVYLIPFFFWKNDSRMQLAKNNPFVFFFLLFSIFCIKHYKIIILINLFELFFQWIIDKVTKRAYVFRKKKKCFKAKGKNQRR